MGRSNNQRRKTAKKNGTMSQLKFKKTKSKWKKQAQTQMRERIEKSIIKKGYVLNAKGVIKKKKYK